MENEQNSSSSLNKLITLFKENNALVYFAFAFIVLLIIIILMVIFLINNAYSPKRPSLPASPTSRASVSLPPPLTTAPTLANTDAAIASPAQAAIIQQQTQPYITQHVAVSYTVPKIKTYGDTWALMEIDNPDTDPANVVVEKVDGTWQVKLGPGTHFDTSALQQIGAPQSLIDDANSAL